MNERKGACKLCCIDILIRITFQKINKTAVFTPTCLKYNEHYTLPQKIYTSFITTQFIHFINVTSRIIYIM